MVKKMAYTITNLICANCGEKQVKITGTPDPKYCGYCGKELKKDK